MKELTHEAKIAIIKILNEILVADNVVRKSEVEYLNEIIKSFEFHGEYEVEVDNMKTLQALSIIRILPIDQKNEVAKMMGKMIIVDEDINYNEVKLYNSFCESCDIKSSFNIEEYPEYLLSGSFTDFTDRV